MFTIIPIIEKKKIGEGMLNNLIFLLTVLLLAACSKSGVADRDFNAADHSTTQCVSPCSKGNEQGNGSDYFFTGDGSAWFLGAQNTIHYCVDVAADFGVDEAVASQAIEEAFERWERYMVTKQIYSHSPEQVKITTRRERKPHCDGSEDLAFYLGSRRPETMFLNEKTGIAVRTSYDYVNGWGKGYVFVAADGTVPIEVGGLGWFPKWSQPRTLAALLTHEIGHIDGTDHVNGTIMRKDIANELSHPHLLGALLDLIDQEQELTICDLCQANYRGITGLHSEAPQQDVTQDTSRETFQTLVGAEAEGGPNAIKIRLEGSFQKGLMLQVSDAIGTHTFPLTLDYSNRSKYEDNRDVFKVVKSSPPQQHGTVQSTMTAHIPHSGWSANGTIVTQTGEILPLVIRRNMEFPGGLFARYPLTIGYLSTGIEKLLFAADAKSLNGL